MRKRQEKENISRIFVETLLRDASYVMPSHHLHPYYEIYYVEQGSCRFFLGERFYDITSGDMLLIPPGTVHYTRYLFGGCKRSAVFFRIDDISGIVSSMPGGMDFFSVPRILQASEFSRLEFNRLFAEMVAEDHTNDLVTSELLKLKLCELLLLTVRYCKKVEAPEEIRTTDRQIVRAALFMSDNYSRKISSPEIAAAAGFSPNYFSARFREATGIGVHEYLIYIRLRQAALELRGTSDSVTEIAMRCGFSDGNYFKDVFKKHYGLTPRDYRKQFLS